MRLPRTLLCLAALLAVISLRAEDLTGKILFEIWKDIGGGTAVGDLTGNENFPTKPSEFQYLSAFDAPENLDDNFGGRIRGYVHPPASGNYTFWIASDDNSELWLSTDEDPKNKVKLCGMPEWCEHNNFDKNPAQKSQPIKLEAGKKYYIEALYKEGGGGDNCSVGWQLPDGKMERPIPGNRLSGCEKPKITPPLPPTVTLKSEIPQKPGHYKLLAEMSKGGVNPLKLPFALYIPPTYDKNQDKYPVIMFLHGAGEGGEDCEALYVHGPLAALRGDPGKMVDAIPFIVVAPQCVPGHRWTEPMIYKSLPMMLDLVMSKLRADRDRVTVTGLSMGGRGTWRCSLEWPDFWAAIVPISSDDYRKTEAPQLTKRCSVWIIAGAEDGGFTEGSRAQVKAYEDAGVKVNNAIVAGQGHGVWGLYYPNPDFYKWVLKQKRKEGPPIMPGSDFPSTFKASAEAVPPPAVKPPESAVVKAPEPPKPAPVAQPAPPPEPPKPVAKLPEPPKPEAEGPSELEKMVAKAKAQKELEAAQKPKVEEPKPAVKAPEVKVAAPAPAVKAPEVKVAALTPDKKSAEKSPEKKPDVLAAAVLSPAYDGPHGTTMTWVLLGLGGGLLVFGAFTFSGRSAPTPTPRRKGGSSGSHGDDDEGGGGGGDEDAPRPSRIPPPRSTTVGGRPRVKVGSRM